MSATFRSHLAVALAAALLAVLAATGLQAAFAEGGDPTPGAIAPGDVYYRTKVFICNEGGTHCTFNPLRVNCFAGDEAIGGIAWAYDDTAEIINLASTNMADHPVSTGGWRVVSATGNIKEDFSVKIRVYCANTG